MIAGGYMATSACRCFVMLGVVVFFYCLGALYEERATAASCSGSRCRCRTAPTVLSKVAHRALLWRR